MKWTDDLVALATKASKKAADLRQGAAFRKYKAMTASFAGGVVSSQTLKDSLGLKKPHSALRVMEKYGLITKVRRIPQHWEYAVMLKPSAVPAVPKSHQPTGGLCINCLHRTENCSSLPFEAMRVLVALSDGTRVVKCRDYARINTGLP